MGRAWNRLGSANFFLLVSCVLILSTRVAVAESNSITLRVASVAGSPGTSLPGDGLKLWMDKVTQKTNGRVKFEAFWGASLGPPVGHADLVEKGMVDFAQTCRNYTPGKFALGQFQLVFPFGPPDTLMVTKATRQLYEEIPAFREELAKNNLLLVMDTGMTPYNFLSKNPITKLEDFQGKRVGCFGQYFGRWVKAIGAVPVVSTMADRYTMLQTGVIDVDLHPTDTLFSTRTYEVAPHYIQVDCAICICFDLLANLKSWNKLPPDIQKIMLESGLETELELASELAPKWTKKALDAFQASGVKMSKLSSEDRAKWAQSVEDIPAEWAAEVSKKGLPGWEIVRRYQEITEKLGYKWPRKWGVKK